MRPETRTPKMLDSGNRLYSRAPCLGADQKTRIHTGPEKPGKSWNFIMAFSRTGKSWKKAAGPGKFWKSVKLS